MYIPSVKLKELSTKYEITQDSEQFARLLDQLDELRSQRNRFDIPKKKNVPNCE